MGNAMSSVDNYLVTTGLVDIQSLPAQLHNQRPGAFKLQPAMLVLHLNRPCPSRHCRFEPTQTSRLRCEQRFRETGFQWPNTREPTRNDISRRCTPRVIPIEVVLVPPIPCFERHRRT